MDFIFPVCRAQLAELDRRLDEFSARGIDAVEPDGRVYYESILSMPAVRPRLDDLLRGIGYWTKVGCPARGDA